MAVGDQRLGIDGEPGADEGEIHFGFVDEGSVQHGVNATARPRHYQTPIRDLALEGLYPHLEAPEIQLTDTLLVLGQLGADFRHLSRRLGCHGEAIQSVQKLVALPLAIRLGF